MRYMLVELLFFLIFRTESCIVFKLFLVHYASMDLSLGLSLCLCLSLALSPGVPEETGPQAGPGLLPPETSPAPHKVPAAAQGSVHLSQSVMESPVEMQLTQ